MHCYKNKETFKKKKIEHTERNRQYKIKIGKKMQSNVFLILLFVGVSLWHSYNPCTT